MDFYVYDNLSTYKKTHTVDMERSPDAMIPVKKIVIPPNGAFWFESKWDREEHSVNTQSPYVHIHNNMTTRGAKFEGNMVDITEKIRYDPKTKMLEGKTMRNFLGKTIWKKYVVGHYYGSKIPEMPMFIEPGNIYYNFYNDSMSFMLGYYPAYANKIDWKKVDEEELATPEQLQYLAILEQKVKDMEEALRLRDST